MAIKQHRFMGHIRTNSGQVDYKFKNQLLLYALQLNIHSYGHFCAIFSQANNIRNEILHFNIICSVKRIFQVSII